MSPPWLPVWDAAVVAVAAAARAVRSIVHQAGDSRNRRGATVTGGPVSQYFGGGIRGAYARARVGVAPRRAARAA
jgi:hypothetical protein